MDPQTKPSRLQAQCPLTTYCTVLYTLFYGLAWHQQTHHTALQSSKTRTLSSPLKPFSCIYLPSLTCSIEVLIKYRLQELCLLSLQADPIRRTVPHPPKAGRSAEFIHSLPLPYQASNSSNSKPDGLFHDLSSGKHSVQLPAAIETSPFI
ncbi:hypothetical protein BKA65DRAFT_494863 [Rhexocercosporidium sp. MPI-PUGE-AT-0058]|nr:hypothetical protein BKA65DRAFT_494863 [Rhexocercosporidium sp. MPI-PUGE-AT-0058]